MTGNEVARRLGAPRITEKEMKVRAGFYRAMTATLGFAAIGLVGATQGQAQAPVPLKIAVLDGFSGNYGDANVGEVEAMDVRQTSGSWSVLDTSEER